MNRTLMLALAAGGLATGAARAQFSWNNPAGGQWNQSLNWTPLGVPNGPTAAAFISQAGTYQVSLNGQTTLQTLSKTNPNATLFMPDNTNLRLMTGAHINDGPMVIGNGGGVNWTYLSLVGTPSIGGTGTIVLDAHPANLDTAFITHNAGGDFGTFGAGQTVRGSGRVFASLVNNGTVQADINGRTLQLQDNPKTNNSVFKAVNGGILGIFNCAVTQNAGGVVRADGGQVHLYNMGLTGGDIQSMNGGLTRITAGSATLENVTVSGPFRLDDNTVLRIPPGGFINNGTVTIGTGAGVNWTYLNFFGTPSIGGVGTIVLDAHPANLDTAFINPNAGGDFGTFGAGQTVRGSGRVISKIVNNGTVQADVSGRSLQLQDNPKTNNSVFKAMNGGILGIVNCAITQGASGIVRADGGEVHLSNMGLTGGELQSMNGGLTRITAGSATLENVTVSGPFRLDDNTVLRIPPGGFINNGTVTIGTGAGVNWTYLNFFGTPSIGGVGTIVLDAHPANLDTAFINPNAGGDFGTFGAGQTVRGSGRVISKIVNNGTVQADVSGRSLQLQDNPKTNNSVFKAMNGGILGIVNCAITQGASGIVRADGGEVHLDNMSLTGGLVNATNGGLTRVTGGTVTFDGAKVSGPMQLNDNTVLALTAGGLENNGHIKVGNAAGNNWTYLRFYANGTLSGTGTVELAANPANFDTAFLSNTAGGIVGTIGPNQTVKGNGRFHTEIANQGTVAPGSSIGQLQAMHPYTQTASGVLDIEIGGTAAGQHDVFAGPGSKALDGKLKLSLVNGYVPTTAHLTTVVTGNSVSGQFATIEAPTLPGSLRWRVEYSPTSVAVRVTCYPDCNADGVMNIADFGCFQTNFAVGNTYADCNGDGMMNLADFGCFQTKFVIGCP